jgi:hypothetical protein
MLNRDPKCVFVASDVGQATVLANWLQHEGIRAQVMDTMTHGGLDGLTAWTGVSARGIEVWAIMPAEVDRARLLIAQRYEALTELLAKKTAAGPAEAHCDKCGKNSEFSGDKRGSVQNCPHCGSYVDVPDGDNHGADDDEEWALGEATDAEGESTTRRSAPHVHSRLRSLKKPIIILFFACVALSILWRVLVAIMQDFNRMR